MILFAMILLIYMYLDLHVYVLPLVVCGGGGGGGGGGMWWWWECQWKGHGTRISVIFCSCDSISCN